MPSRFDVSPDVMIRKVGEESVILDLKTERYLGLDDVSSRFWELVTNGKPVQEAYDQLLVEFDVEPDRLRTDLDDFVAELLDLGLIVQTEQ